MPKVRRSKKPPPEGWELIEPTLDELDQKMREGLYKKIKKYARTYFLKSQKKIKQNDHVHK